MAAFFTQGEGWHNYHHIFPWDYSTGELGIYDFNGAGRFIEFFAKIGMNEQIWNFLHKITFILFAVGWAYDLKSVSLNMIKKRATRTGDGSLFKAKPHTDNDESLVIDDEKIVYGWNDDEMPAKYKKDALNYKFIKAWLDQ